MAEGEGAMYREEEGGEEGKESQPTFQRGGMGEQGEESVDEDEGQRGRDRGEDVLW